MLYDLFYNVKQTWIVQATVMKNIMHSRWLACDQMNTGLIENA